MAEEEKSLTRIPEAETLGALIREMMGPTLEMMAKYMQHNTEALDRLAASQKVQADRIEALERQFRLNTPVTPAQVRYFNDGIKKRARELLEKQEMAENRKAVNRLTGAIRKSVLTVCGAAALNEIPRYEYSVVMDEIAEWSDPMTVRDIVKKERENEHQAIKSGYD